MKRGERGFVLAAILGLITIAAAVVGGACFAALQELRIGRATVAAVRAMRAAESGAGAVLASWNSAAMNNIPVGDSQAVAPGIAGSIGSATAVVRPLGLALMLVRVRGVDPTGLAERELAWVLRIRMPRLLVPGVVASVAPLPGTVAAAIDPDDRPPAGFSCPDPEPPIAPVAAPWTEAWTDWDSLAARAAMGPSAPDAANPIVLVNGNLRLSSGVVFGVLMVDGDLDMDVGAQIVGVLLVRGTVRLRGPGPAVTGVLRAASVSADPGALAGGGPLVVYSTCAVARALRLGAGVEPVRERFWVDLSLGW